MRNPISCTSDINLKHIYMQLFLYQRLPGKEANNIVLNNSGVHTLYAHIYIYMDVLHGLGFK